MYSVPTIPLLSESGVALTLAAALQNGRSVSKTVFRLDAQQGCADLQREVGNLATEEINEGAHTAPSKRIIRHLPAYERSKVRVGAPAAAAIGLPALRAKCPHFDDWLTRLEKLV